MGVGTHVDRLSCMSTTALGREGPEVHSCLLALWDLIQVNKGFKAHL